MDETKSKTEEKPRRRTKPTHICRETGDHVHYPPTRPTKPTRPPHAPPPILESIFRLPPEPRYGECRKNQAPIAAGTTAYDGCGEFVSSDPGQDSLDCAACGCHRSFHHREESLSGGTNTILEVLKISPSQFRQIFCSPYGDGETDEEGKKRIATDRSPEEEAGRAKRVKTRFTTEQTEKMRSYAEKVGWKVSSESRERVKEFCDGIGVTRRKLRVWMNNHHEDKGRVDEEEEGRVKRFKTKFTAEQTERMRSYAEKLRWKVRAEDREETEVFCSEIGVNLNKFVIWMNNHKVEERD
ncbi:Zinc-finger homeodomain protein 13 [Hirschfeldia incana]|nr:Zinc-finger homeodomain protein 13 [Hirschfeldia incana]